MQLSAVEAGGAMRLLVNEGAARTMDRVHRFTDPDEAAASLALRAGRVSSIGSYESHGRLTDGSGPAMVDQLSHAWLDDQAAGRSTLMISSSTPQVAALSARARRDRVTRGQVETGGVVLHDGNTAGVGDLGITRLNQRTLPVGHRRAFVKNGDQWPVVKRGGDESLTVRHLVWPSSAARW